MQNWLPELFQKQHKLDTYILAKEIHPNLKVSVLDTANALFVEIGEFLNEVRAFKHWSIKEMDKEKAHEEFVDGLHFLLSVGNDMWEFYKLKPEMLSAIYRLENAINSKIEFQFNKYNKKCEGQYREQFVSLSYKVFTSSNYLLGTLEEYMAFFINYLTLGVMVGLDVKSIVEEYNKKHEINYVRQTQNY